MRNSAPSATPRHRRTLVSLGVLTMLALLQTTAQAQQSAAQADQAPSTNETSQADQARQIGDNATPPQRVAQAQAPAPAGPGIQPEAVVQVTGFRASLNSALNTKKNSDGIVDVIKAEDIAKFPDANLAESLQRACPAWRWRAATAARVNRSRCAA
jgi:iron complex outermembrane receptor protein